MMSHGLLVLWPRKFSAQSVKPAGEREAVPDARARWSDHQRVARSARVHHVQRRRHEHESELDRLGDAGEERGERGRAEDAGDALRRSGRAVWIIARHAAGRANIMIGKKPVMKPPACGSPAKNRFRSPVLPLYSPNWNHSNEFGMWCRPNGSSSRLIRPYTPAPTVSWTTIQLPRR